MGQLGRVGGDAVETGEHHQPEQAGVSLWRSGPGWGRFRAQHFFHRVTAS